MLFGDLNEQKKDKRKEALWRSEPENPAFFSEYASAYIVEHDTLPPDFLMTARRIDPENAWFLQVAAAVEAKNSVKKKTGKRKRVAGKMVPDQPPSWEILDQARFDRSLALLSEAREYKKCKSYGIEMMRQRIPLLPLANYFEWMDSISCLASSSFLPSLGIMHLSNVIAAKAWLAGEAGDVKGFQKISADAETFFRGTFCIEEGLIIDELVFSRIVLKASENLAPAAKKLGLADEATRWENIAAQLRKRNEARGTRAFVVVGRAVKTRSITSSFMGSLEIVSKQVEGQPLLDR